MCRYEIRQRVCGHLVFLLLIFESAFLFSNWIFSVLFLLCGDEISSRTANSLVHVFSYVFSVVVQVTTSGAESGQGLVTKVAQAVAFGLGVDISTITVMTNSTEKIPNSGTTGGSSTSEQCVQVRCCGFCREFE